MKWILDAWNELPTDVIRKSFTSCALSIPVDGSEDDAIHCFKERQPCSIGLVATPLPATKEIAGLAQNLSAKRTM